MFDDILEKIKQIFASRLIPIFIILIILFTILVNKLFEIQIIEGQKKRSNILFTRHKKDKYRGNKGNDKGFKW